MVSSIGFGAMRIPQVPLAQAIETVRLAVELGINLFETAPGYGDSEQRLGKALKGLRDKVYLSSKSANRDGAGLRKDLEESLRRMRTEYLDLYHLWCVNHRHEFEDAIKKGGALEEIKKAKAHGLVRHIGITTHARPQDIIDFIQTGEFETVEIYYNVADRGPRVVLPVANRLDVGVMIMGPLRGGFLAHGSPRLGFLRGGLELTNAQGALLWLLSQGEIATALVGHSHPEEVRQALAVLDTPPFVEEKLAEIAGAMEGLSGGKQNICGGCGYCAPCPEGIFIPAILSLLYYYDVLELKDYASSGYARMDVKGDSCTQCNQCIPRCPHNIDIPERLRDAHSKLTG
jgi:predicted aldo/keto reductase-like oxidoreductase